MTRRARLVPLVLAVLLAAAPPSRAGSPLRVAVSLGPVSLPLYVAEAEHFLDDEHVDARLEDCNSGRECFERLRAHQADVATAAELVAALDAQSGGQDAVIVAVICNSGHHIKLVAHAGPRDAADLRGRRVGMVAGTSAQYFLDALLLSEGVDARTVTRVPLKVDELVDAFAQRRVDAVAIWEPLASLARNAAEDARVLSSANVYPQHFSLLAPRVRDVAQEAALVGLLRAVARAERLIVDRPDEAARVLARRLHMSPAAAQAALGEQTWRLALAPTLLSTLDAQARWAQREGLAGVPAGRSPRPVAGVVDVGPLRKADPDAVTLPRP